MDEANLFDRLRHDDRDAFEAIFRQWYDPLVRFGESMLHDRAAAEELAQDVLTAVWAGRRRLPDRGAPGAYLFKAVRNRALNEIRHRKVKQRVQPLLRSASLTGPDAEDNLVDDEIRAALAEAVEALPPRVREVFELSRVHGLRYAEIAETLEISVKTVESHMGTALRLLRGRMRLWTE